MRAIKNISPWQFAAFRILFGFYLTVHFAYLIPYGRELFSREGVLPQARLNFTFGILPNPLEHFDSPAFVVGFLVTLTLLAVALAIGFCRRTAALLLWYGWACLFNRNNLKLNGDGVFDRRMGVVAADFEVFESVIEDGGGFALNG